MPQLHAGDRHARDRRRPRYAQPRTGRHGLERELAREGVLGAVRPGRVRHSPGLEKDDTAFAAWMKEVAALSAARQAEAVKKKLMERNPGYGGEGDWKVEDRGVTAFAVTSQHLADLAPLRALPALTELRINGDEQGESRPLGAGGAEADRPPPRRRGGHRPLAAEGDAAGDPGLSIQRDHRPLAAEGDALWLFNCPGNPIADLAPLRGMQLGHLACDGSRVSDLSPLKGMPLGYLAFTDTNVSDLKPLEGMPWRPSGPTTRG